MLGAEYIYIYIYIYIYYLYLFVLSFDWFIERIASVVIDPLHEQCWK